jgi:hypothetical protein
MVTGAFPKYAIERQVQTPVLSNDEAIAELVGEYRGLIRHLHVLNQLGSDDAIVVEARLRQIRAELVAGGAKVPHELAGNSLMDNS